MSALGVFNLLAITAAVIALAWWGARAAIRGTVRLADAERTKLRPADERQRLLDDRQALLDAIEDADDRAAVEAVLRRADWRRAHEEGRA